MFAEKRSRSLEADYIGQFIVNWWMNRILLKKRRKEGNLGRSMHGRRKTWLCREPPRLFLKLKGYHVLDIMLLDLYAFYCLILSVDIPILQIRKQKVREIL